MYFLGVWGLVTSFYVLCDCHQWTQGPVEHICAVNMVYVHFYTVDMNFCTIYFKCSKNVRDSCP
jgi:hypothetical protein